MDRHTRIINQIVTGTKNDLLAMPLSELRAFVALCHTKSEGQATDLLASNTRTVGRQRKAIDRTIHRITGENAFIDSEQRGGELGFTTSGRIFFEHAEKILQHLNAVGEKLQKPRPLRLAFTNYMLEIPVVGDILREAQARLGVALKLRHIASHEVGAVLRAQLVDFAFGGVLIENSKPRKVEKGLTCQPLRTNRVGLLSNYEIKEGSDVRDLLERERAHLLPPTHGIFLDVLQAYLRKDEIDRLPGIRSENIQFALDILSFSYQPKACIILEESMCEIMRSRGRRKRLWFTPFENHIRVQQAIFHLQEKGKPPMLSQLQKHGISERPIAVFEEIVAKHAAKPVPQISN